MGLILGQFSPSRFETFFPYPTLVAWSHTILLLSLTLSVVFLILRTIMGVDLAKSFTFLLPLIFFAFGVGITASVSTILFAVSAYLITHMLRFFINKGVPSYSLSSRIRPPGNFIVGWVFLLAIFSGLLHLGYAFTLIIFMVLLSPLLFLLLTTVRQSIKSEFQSVVKTCQNFINSCSEMVFVLGLIAIVIPLLFVLFPTMSYDDNVSHLRMWTEIRTSGTYSFDYSTHVGSLLPFNLDLIHGILSTISGTDARGALNLFLALSTFVILAWWTERFELDKTKAILLIALFASTPLFAWSMASLHVELLLLLIGVVLFTVLFFAKDFDPKLVLMTVASSTFLLLSTKATGAILASLILMPFMSTLWRLLKGFVRNPGIVNKVALMIVASISLLVGIQPFLIAFVKTGNPVFPFFNGVFQSPYFPTSNFENRIFGTGPDPIAFFHMFFDTSSYMESYDFVAGFQYLILVPIGLFVFRRKFGFVKVLQIIIPMFLFVAITFSSTHYLRYIFPVAGLATLVIGSLFMRDYSIKSSSQKNRITTLITGVAIACLAFNLIVTPGVSWFFRESPLSAITANQKKEMLERVNPVASLTESFVNEEATAVLYPLSNPFGARLKYGKPIYLNWYNANAYYAFIEVNNEASLRDFFDLYDISHVISNIDIEPNNDISQSVLQNVLVKRSRVIRKLSNFVIFDVTGFRNNI
jgi:hypothetical protein